MHLSHLKYQLNYIDESLDPTFIFLYLFSSVGKEKKNWKIIEKKNIFCLLNLIGNKGKASKFLKSFLYIFKTIWKY